MANKRCLKAKVFFSDGNENWIIPLIASNLFYSKWIEAYRSLSETVYHNQFQKKMGSKGFREGGRTRKSFVVRLGSKSARKPRCENPKFDRCRVSATSTFSELYNSFFYRFYFLFSCKEFVSSTYRQKKAFVSSPRRNKDIVD